MANVAIPVTQIPPDDGGIRVDTGSVAADAVNGNSYTCDRNTGLYIDNTNAGVATVTLQATVKGAAFTKVINLAASEKRMLPPVDMSIWGQHGGPDDGKVYVLASAITVKFYPVRWYMPANG